MKLQGCDASILLNGANGEQDADENIGLRPGAIQTIENLRALVRKQCPRVVSCSDILVIAAREAVRQVIHFHPFYINLHSFFLFFFRIYCLVITFKNIKIYV